VIPLGSNGSTQTLTAIDRVLDGGTSPPGFSQFLSREGIEYVIERNDLNLAATGAPVPAQVHEVLSETPGLFEVASFGPLLTQRQTGIGAPNVYDAKADTHLRQVEIFRVRGTTSPIHAYPVADPIVVSGDAASLLPLEGAHVLAGRASFLAGDPQAGRPPNAADATWAITDGNQRRDVQYGGVRNNSSYLLGPDQTSSSKAVGVPLTYLVVPGTSRQTVESPIGAASASASSYGSSTLYAQPVNGPYAAFDNDANTAWIANATNGSVGQWVSITFDRPVPLSTISVTPLIGSPLQPVITKVTITTERGSVTRRLPDRSVTSQLDVPKGPSKYLKLSIAAVRTMQTPSGGLDLGAGIVDIHVPGVSFRENMRVPDDESAALGSPQRKNPVIVFDRPLLNQNLLLGSGVSDDPEVARTFAIPQPMTTDVSGHAVPLPGPALETLLEYYTPPRPLHEQVLASSWFNNLPRFRVENLLDNAGSPWIAGTGDSRPTVILGWSGQRSVDSIVLTPTDQASRPTEISVSGATGPAQIVSVPASGGLIRFDPIVTNQLRIEVLQRAPRRALSPAYGVQTTLPVGIQSLRVPALGAAGATPPNASFPLVLQCGQGPPVTIDGVTYPTSVSGTLGDLMDLRPVEISACSHGIALSAGQHSLHAPSTFGAFDVTSLALDNPLSVASAANGHTARSANVVQWTASSRTLRVGAGPATYVVLPQNYNDAWVATFGGRTLTSVRVDGWQQGYIVPSGGAGTIQLTMPSDSLFHLGLLLGAILLVVILLLAVLPSRRDEPEAVGPRPVASGWVVAVLAVAALVLVGGILALVGVPLLWVARRWGQNVMAAVAFATFVAAGCVVAWHAGALPNLQTGAFGRPAQVASVVAFGAVLCAAVSEYIPRHRRSDRLPEEN
jgi:arabinofuranan 3-O-arabinosyltransferase